MAQSVIVDSTPPDADFAFYIDFAKGIGSAERVFIAAQEFIRACEEADRILCNVIDPEITPVLALERLETGSLKIWLRNSLKAIDDDALKQMDWRPLVGKYLVKSKYLILDWLERDSAIPKSLPHLAEQIRNLAAETNVKHLPDYMRPRPENLLTALGHFQAAKKALLPEDKAEFVSPEGNVQLDLNVHWEPEKLAELAVSKTITSKDICLILAVRKPDYLGTSQWDFRHGKSPIRAKITDVEWLAKFQSRQKDVRPGDALECIVTVKSTYGFDNELIEQTHTVTQVLDVLVDSYRQQSML